MFNILEPRSVVLAYLNSVKFASKNKVDGYTMIAFFPITQTKDPLKLKGGADIGPFVDIVLK